MEEPNGSMMMSVDIGLEMHKVEAPPYRSTLRKLQTRLKETFFPDDPLRQFKGQSVKRKWILGAQYAFPILKWGPEYSLQVFKSDIVAGLTIASLAIPQVPSLPTLQHQHAHIKIIYMFLARLFRNPGSDTMHIWLFSIIY